MPKLSIIVPVFNEERHLPELLDRFMGVPLPVDREWIFVDDASTDGSLALLEAARAKHGLKVIHQERNQGKGASAPRGIPEAAGEFIMIQDADFEYDPKEIPQLLQPMLENRADVVF